MINRIRLAAPATLVLAHIAACCVSFLPTDFAHGKVWGQNDACTVLIAFAQKAKLAVIPASDGNYYCNTAPLSKGYYVIDLHYSYHAEPGFLGSNLVGWYAVRREDGSIFDWDVGDWKAGGILYRRMTNQSH